MALPLSEIHPLPPGTRVLPSGEWMDEPGWQRPCVVVASVARSEFYTQDDWTGRVPVMFESGERPDGQPEAFHLPRGMLTVLPPYPDFTSRTDVEAWLTAP